MRRRNVGPEARGENKKNKDCEIINKLNTIASENRNNLNFGAIDKLKRICYIYCILLRVYAYFSRSHFGELFRRIHP